MLPLAETRADDDGGDGLLLSTQRLATLAMEAPCFLAIAPAARRMPCSTSQPPI